MKKVYIFLTVIAVLSLIMATFTGCSTYKKQKAKAEKFYEEYPADLAAVCAEEFPVKDSIGLAVIDSTRRALNANYRHKIDSIYWAAEQYKADLINDTIGMNAECKEVILRGQDRLKALVQQIDQLKRKYKPCESDTIYKTQTIYRENTAKLFVAQNDLKIKSDSLLIVKTQYQVEKDKAKNRLYLLIGLLGVGIVGIILKFKGIL